MVDGKFALLYDLEASDIGASGIELPTGMDETESCKAAFSEEGRWIAVLARSGRIHVWNLLERELIQTASKLIFGSEE